MGPQHAEGPCKSVLHWRLHGKQHSAVSWNRPVPARDVEFFRVIKCSKSVPVRTDIFNSHNYNTKQLTQIRILKFRQRVLCQVVVVVSSIFQWYPAGIHVPLFASQGNAIFAVCWVPLWRHWMLGHKGTDQARARPAVPLSCQWSVAQQRTVAPARYRPCFQAECSIYSIHAPVWLQKWLNLITAPVPVSNEPGSVTWLATKYLKINRCCNTGR